MNYTTFYYYTMSNLEGGGEYQHEGDRILDSRSPGIYCYLFLYIICGVEWVWNPSNPINSHALPLDPRQGQFKVLWGAGVENLADFFTKIHPVQHHRLVRN